MAENHQKKTAGEVVEKNFCCYKGHSKNEMQQKHGLKPQQKKRTTPNQKGFFSMLSQARTLWKMLFLKGMGSLHRSSSIEKNVQDQTSEFISRHQRRVRISGIILTQQKPISCFFSAKTYQIGRFGGPHFAGICALQFQNFSPRFISCLVFS